MDIRVIKTKQQYRRYLEEVDRLVALDPDPRTAERAARTVHPRSCHASGRSCNEPWRVQMIDVVLSQASR
jgi:antitoxin component HigA of HigAB toxin-antitoxin module